MNEPSNKTLIVVVGPTASGKTGTAVRLAKELSCEIISTDSRQFYKEMSIGTAKPSKDEQDGVPHHFIDSLSIHDAYSAGQFEEEALKKCEELFLSNQYIVAVGGSGLFIDALCYGLDALPKTPAFLRDELNELLENKGIEYIQELAQKTDPEFWKNCDQSNPHRLLRAIEVFKVSGQKLSSLQQNKKRSRPFKIILIGLDMKRETLYERINKRVDLMLDQGLLNEVESLREHAQLNALQTVGYKEFYENESSEEGINNAIALVKRNSRRYAKRQMTWFRKNESIHWFNPLEKDCSQSILNFIKQQA